ncbi:unnamed protein product [Dovyalis caffra]|uniref:Thioredoxin domain-containing protein n=1 Tax=Dovyalis caffra TaxID=77055 RepID=A0AAV1S645_9ROSI|nr:unnamed protein product [Dovyalis caffra]
MLGTSSLRSEKGLNTLIVVDFTAAWCGPCKLIAPAVENLAKKLPNVTFLKVDVDELKEHDGKEHIYKNTADYDVGKKTAKSVSKMVGSNT